MEYLVPFSLDADHKGFFQLFLPTMSDSGGVQAAQLSASQSDNQIATDGHLDDLFAPPDSIGPAPVHSPQDQPDAGQDDPTDSNKIIDVVMSNIYSSAPSVFLPTSLTQEVAHSSSSPSSTGEYEYVPETDVHDDSPPPVTAETSQPALLHPSLRRIQPPTRASPQSESSGEPELYELDEESELEVIVTPPPKKRKRTTATSTAGEPPAKRTRLPRETKTSANKRLKVSTTPPKPSRQPRPAPPPKRKRRTPSPPKEKPLPSSKPGYPYWGAEHSANPPPVVSTPIERREIGLHTLVDPPAGERPGYNYITLIKHAILGCPDKKLTIDGIYEQIMGRFEYYRDQNGKCDKGWKNSVRHQMSLSACFEKKERLLWESGKGVWWVVNESVEGGTKRERKRNRPTRAEKQANPELYPPKAVTLPENEPSLPQPLTFIVEHPHFPKALPPRLTAPGMPAHRSEGFTSQPHLPQQVVESRSSSAPAQQPTITAPSVPTIDQPWATVSTPVSGTGLTLPSFQRPVSVTPTISNDNHPFRSASSIIPFSRSTTSSRPTFGSARNEQGAGPMRDVVHTRWQSSVDLPFDVRPREAGGDDTSDSEDDD